MGIGLGMHGVNPRGGQVTNTHTAINQRTTKRTRVLRRAPARDQQRGDAARLGKPRRRRASSARGTAAPPHTRAARPTKNSATRRTQTLVTPPGTRPVMHHILAALMHPDGAGWSADSLDMHARVVLPCLNGCDHIRGCGVTRTKSNRQIALHEAVVTHEFVSHEGFYTFFSMLKPQTYWHSQSVMPAVWCGVTHEMLQKCVRTRTTQWVRVV